jgi:hypothetical protein
MPKTVGQVTTKGSYLTFSDLRIKFYAKWIEFMGENDIDPDQTGHLQNFKNSFWFRLVRVGMFFMIKSQGAQEAP